MEDFLVLMRVLGSLLFVLVLAWWATRYGLPLGGHLRRKGNIAVVERIPLGLRGSLCLVRVGEKFLLIGVTTASMECLAEIPADQVQETDRQPPPPPDFAAIMAKSKAKISEFGKRWEKQAGAGKERKDQVHDKPQDKDSLS